MTSETTIEDRIAARIARIDAANPFNRTCVVVDDDPSVDEGPVTLDDPRFAAHPVAQANAASWASIKPPKSARRRRLTRAEKIAASEAAGR